jgi:hypothetical protein
MPKSSSYRSHKSGYSNAVSQEQEPFFTPQAPVQEKKEDPFFPAIQRQEISSIQRLATPLEDEAFATNDERMKRDRELREKPEAQGGVGNIQRAPESAGPKKKEPSAVPKRPAPSSPPKTALPQAPAKAPELKPVALLTNDNHCGDMSFMINWELSKDAAAAGGYIVQDITITYLVFDKFGRPVYRQEKSPLHYFEAWRVLPNSKEMDPGSTDNFSFDIHTPDHTASTQGVVYFTAVAQYHDNVSQEEMPEHMVSGNKHTVAGLLLSSTRDPKLGGNVSKSVPHEFYFHWNCTKPGLDHTNVIDKQIP